METIILVIAAIYFLSHLFAALFARTRIPDVLLLVAIGLVLGPLTGTVERSDFGLVGDVLSAMALVVVLFEGGTSISLRAVRRILGHAAVLAVLTFAGTTVITALIVMQVFNFSLFAAILTGVILGGISPAVVIPLIKGLGLGQRAFAMASIECAISDVLAVVIAFGFVAALEGGHISPGHIARDVVLELSVGGMIGAVGGVLWMAVLSAVRNFPNSTLTTIGFLLLLYAITDILGFSGAISAFFFGFVLANYREFDGRVPLLRSFSFESLNVHEHNVFEELIFILKTFFFVYLGISFAINEPVVLYTCIGIVLATYLFRLLITHASTPQSMKWRDASMLSVMIPKGLAAAVLASVPAQAGLAEGEMMQSVVYTALIFSIGWTAIMVPLIDSRPLKYAYMRLFTRSEEPAVETTA